MKALDIYFLKQGINQDDMIFAHRAGEHKRNKDLFKAVYEAKNELIQKRIDEITTEIKDLADGSMATSFKLTALRAVKKELKSLLVSE